MVTNDFLPFATSGGANVENQSTYAGNAQLTIGNQPGVADATFVNKTLRQGAVPASQLMQFVTNVTQTSVQDNGNMTQLLAQIFGAFDRKDPVFTLWTTSGTHNLSYKFQVASANATAGATYTDSVTTFTVSTTISAGLELVATGTAAPITSGTLTKVTGTGDSSITYYAVRAPIYIEVECQGGGGGGAGSSTYAATNMGAGGNGNTSSFGSTLLVANGGPGAGGNTSQSGSGSGGSASIGAGVVGLATAGSGGVPGQYNSSNYCPGGSGGSATYGGQGYGGPVTQAGGAAATSSGSGGGGAGGPSISATGGGGAAGGFAKGTILNSSSAWASTYAVVIGSGGAGGSAGTSGSAGGAGAGGFIKVTERYQ